MNADLEKVIVRLAPGSFRELAAAAKLARMQFAGQRDDLTENLFGVGESFAGSPAEHATPQLIKENFLNARDICKVARYVHLGAQAATIDGRDKGKKKTTRHDFGGEQAIIHRMAEMWGAGLIIAHIADSARKLLVMQNIQDNKHNASFMEAHARETGNLIDHTPVIIGTLEAQRVLPFRPSGKAAADVVKMENGVLPTPFRNAIMNVMSFGLD